METEYRRRYAEIIGLILAAGGLAMILGGWLGLQNKRTVVEQIPFLISGGIGGLAVLVAGVGLVHLTRQFRLERTVADLARQQDELEASLDRFVAALGHTIDLRVPLAAAQNHRAGRVQAGIGQLSPLSVPDAEA
jgi:hypothetical protein